MKKYFKLYACCIAVKGHSRSTVCDIQRNSFEFIPNTLYEILTENLHLSIDEIYQLYNNEYNEVIGEYFDYLIQKDLGFYTTSPQNFPMIDLNMPAQHQLINNVLIDFDHDSDHDMPKLVEQLNSMRCGAVEMRFYCSQSFEKLTHILDYFYDSTIRSISVVVAYDSSLTHENMRFLESNYKRVRKILVHSTPNINEIFYMSGEDISVIFTSQIIDSESCCGNVMPQLFLSNLNLFTESMHFNNCLNRKLSIDKKGFIKNCPSMSTNFGHHKDTFLLDVAKQNAFQKTWTIKKDDIEVCKDCEFRYICIDCRAYTKDNKANTKPKKCKYNPYEAVWES